MFIQKVLFTKSDCNKILELINSNNKVLGESMYGNDEVDVSFEEYKIEDKPENSWFLNTIKKFIYDNIKKIGKAEFNIDANILKYGINDGFSKHIDLNTSHTNPRIYTVGVLLNTEFEGGDLIIYDKQNNKKRLEKIEGNCYLFESTIVHEVEKIIEGIRYSLVIHIRNTEFEKTNLI